ASALQNAAELEKATARRNDLAAKLAELDGDAAALEARRRELALAGDRQRLERLKNTQARLAQTQRSLDALRGLDRSLFTRIQLMQTELDAAEKSASERRAVSSRLLKNIEDTALELSQTDKLISAIDDASRRQRLRAACEELLALERQTPPALAALRRAAPALLALLTALTLALALHGRFGAAAALGVAALAAAAVYFAAMVLLPRENYATLRRAADAKTEYEKARAALHRSWLELEPAAALDRLEREAEGEARLRERRAVTAQLLARYREERQLEEEALAEHGRNAARLRRELETGLSPFGAKDLSELRASVEKLEFLRTERQELRRSAQAEADIKPDSFDTDLEKTIRAMERELADLPPEPAPQGPQENARQAQRAAEELKQLQRRRLELSAQLMHESEGLARLEGALGMPAADAYLLARENQSRLQDLELWARAAEEAFQVLAGLANANEETLKNCVENAGPLFSAMTGGKYLGLRLEENSPLEPGALFARHEQLGEKPLEWLSAGAQDLAWMAMRMEFASSGWREPSFMLLDEPFMALDPARAELALRALSTGPLSKWQFILLTKSPDCADACVRAGMKLFKLEPAPQETA
ncbi:MAG: hypothetical protein GX410_09615, partial [Elusimicrobia bacterium]|nr:hypothetical protein [Elusimicrobiota bacterium]